MDGIFLCEQSCDVSNVAFLVGVLICGERNSCVFSKMPGEDRSGAPAHPPLVILVNDWSQRFWLKAALLCLTLDKSQIPPTMLPLPFEHWLSYYCLNPPLLEPLRCLSHSACFCVGAAER